MFDKFRSEGRKQTRAESVVENLQNILNCKREFGSILKDLGIRSLTEYRSRDEIAAAVMQDVRENIERYEPRLRLKAITLENGDSPFRLSFTVQCELIEGTQVMQVSFDTVFGKFEVARR